MTPKEYFMTAKEYLTERARMTESCSIGCHVCNLSALKTGFNGSCSELENVDPDNAIAIVSEWSKAHPRKSYKDDFLEKFPNAKIEESDYPICRVRVYGGSCNSVRCTDCWNEPMEQEETK